MRSKPNKIGKTGLFLAFMLMGILTFSFFSPVVISHAETLVGEYEVRVADIISMQINTNNLSFVFRPTAEGVFDSKSITATVSTNSSYGYELYFSSADNETDMVAEDSNTVIASDFNGTVTSSSMEGNKWGYSLDNVNFSKIPTLNDHAIIRNLNHFPEGNERNNTVYFGIKVDSRLESGAYEDVVRFTTFAHVNAAGDLPPSFHTISTMQEMTHEICADATTPSPSATQFDWTGVSVGDDSFVPRTVLTDTRDGSKYLVSKLADGNCWMSQNLALDLSDSEELTSADTNLVSKSSWTPEHSTQMKTTSVAWDSLGADGARSYHPADGAAYYQGGTVAASEPTAAGDEYLWEKTGNLYNWYAATAGSGLSTATHYEVVSDSICPKGWSLPDGNSRIRAFSPLLGEVYLTDSNPGSPKDAPLNFIMSGSYSYSNGSVNTTGTFGLFATNTAYSTNRSINLYTTPTSNSNWYNQSRGNGVSVRCVAL